MEIPLTKGQIAFVDDEDFEFLTKHKWQAHKSQSKSSWYARRIPHKRGRAVTIIMHRLITGAPPGVHVDHIDGNGLNNQRSNLRLCTRSQNLANSRLNCKNKSGYKGVFKIARAKVPKWIAYIGVSNYERHYLGTFTDPLSAALAYNQMMTVK